MPVSQRMNTTPLRTLLQALIILAIVPGAAFGQSAGSDTVNQPKRVPVTLSSSPTKLDALGITLFLPIDSKAEMTSFGGNATMGIEFPEDLGIMVIKGQRTRNPDLTITQVVDSIIDQLMRSNGRESIDGRMVDTTVTIRERTPDLNVDGIVGERVYLDFPSFNGDPALVRGFTVFRAEPLKFIVFDLMTEAGQFATSRGLYETTIGTMDLTTLDQRGEARAAAIERAQAVIDSMGADELRSLADKYSERWERLYSPARSGDDADATEHGYRRVRVSSGVKGEVTGKAERNWRPGDRIPGFIVRLDAMALEPSLRIDTRAVYFVSEDFEQEAWTVNMALRQGESSTESSVTGARVGTSMTVQLEQSRLPPQITKPVIQGEGYLSQTIAQLMVPILIRNAQEGDFAFYSYNPSSNNITLRTDTVEQPTESPGLWVVRSKPDENTPEAKHLYNATGELIRTELHNGRIWEPIELDRLVSLWRRKGLPLE
ncbi:MAG: hypothetical protein AB8F26_00850 [Phycisphaerales bacterium]